jgi:Gpi18-like mannosyltransferase
VAVGVALILAGALYIPMLPFSVSDFNNFVGPWLIYIREHGGFLAMGDSFSEYAPPYLYLLAIATHLALPVDDQTLVKLINVPFVALIAWSIFLICRRFDRSIPASTVAACGVLFLPTLGVNAFVWGQADTIYTPFLLLSVFLALKGRPYWAVAMFSVALAIKLQGIFLAPFLAFMVMAGRIPWTAAFVVPVVYVLSLLPCVLLGRPFVELLQVYVVQGKYYHRLSMNAPNPYFWADHLLGASNNWTVYKLGTLVGLLIAAVSGAAVMLIGVARKRLTDKAILLAASLSMTVMPFVLPKMHDRFFFGADLFAYALAWVDRRFLWLAIGMQTSSILSYLPEFALYVLPGEATDWAWAVDVGAVVNVLVIAGLLRALKGELGVLIRPTRLKRRAFALLRLGLRILRASAAKPASA